MAENYTPFLKYLKIHKQKLALIVLLALIEAFFTTIGMGSISTLLFAMGAEQQTSGSVNPSMFGTNFILQFQAWMKQLTVGQPTFNRVLTIAFILVGVFIVKNIIAYIRRVTTSWLELSVVFNIREDVYRFIQKITFSEFAKKKHGHYLTLLTNDINQVLATIKPVFDQLLTEPFKVILALMAIISISPQLLIAIVIIAPVTSIVIAKIGNKIKKRAQLTVEQMDVYMGFLNETLTGVRVTKAFAAEDFQFSRYMKEQTKLKLFQFRQSVLVLLNMPLTEALGSIMVVGIIVIGAKLMETNPEITAESFTSVLILLVSIIEPLKKMGHLYNQFKVAMVSAVRLLSVMDTPNDDQVYGNEPKTEFNEAITFQHVSFQYDTDAAFGLKDVSFDLKKGETVALVGASGSGKSTIADLLGRFYKIENGALSIDGIPINSINNSDLRKLITVVPQESFLFNDTVKNNIRFNMANATDDAIYDASKMANAYEFILKLDHGFDTWVGERGSALSGGQRQRIAIARAIVTKAPIIILDEATSALDSESEKVVQNAIDNLMKDHTVLVIAHRLSTIVKADKIIVMDHGEIVESGTHQELLSASGMYKKLYDIQFESSL